MEMEEKLVKSSSAIELTEALVLTRTRSQSLENVRKLNCWASNIGDVSVVCNMPNLEVCSISINKLTTLKDFSHCPNLQELYVRTNNIQHLSDIHHLKNLRKLHSLWLSENPCALHPNYRMTVLKTLSNLHKLDNIVVTDDEIVRAKKEGDDLPLPDDFILRSDLNSSLEGHTDERSPSDSTSESSDKWTLPRQKRQQRKREDLEREKRSFEEESRWAVSGDDGSGCVKSDYWQRSKTRQSKYSSQSENTGNEEENNVYDMEDEDGYGKKSNDGPVSAAKDEKQCTSDAFIYNCECEAGTGEFEEVRNERDEEKNKMSVEKDTQDGIHSDSFIPKENCCQVNVGSPVPGLSDELGAAKEKDLSHSDSDSGKATDSDNLLLPNDLSSNFAGDISVCSPLPSNLNNNAICDENSFKVGKSHQSMSMDACKYINSIHCQHSDYSLLDQIRMEDSLNVQDSVTDQETFFKNEQTSEPAILNLNPVSTAAPYSCSAECPGQTGMNEEATAASSLEIREAINWEDYNHLRIQAGIRPIDGLVSQTRPPIELMRAKNSNILQAVLCLIKELDKDSLDIVASVIKRRLDTA